MKPGGKRGERGRGGREREGNGRGRGRHTLSSQLFVKKTLIPSNSRPPLFPDSLSLSLSCCCCSRATMPGPAHEFAPEPAAPAPPVGGERGRSSGGGAATPSGDAMREDLLRARAAVRQLQRRSSTLRRTGEEFVLPGSVVDAEFAAPLLAPVRRFCSSSVIREFRCERLRRPCRSSPFFGPRAHPPPNPLPPSSLSLANATDRRGHPRVPARHLGLPLPSGAGP